VYVCPNLFVKYMRHVLNLVLINVRLLLYVFSIAMVDDKILLALTFWKWPWDGISEPRGM
jgi:hypothetical protein